MPTIGFLHTEPGHVAAFARLVAERAPGLVDVHLVDTVLAELHAQGRLEDVRVRLGSRVGELIGRAVDAVVCTHAPLHEEAGRATGRVGVPAFRPEQLGAGTPFALVG